MSFRPLQMPRILLPALFLIAAPWASPVHAETLKERQAKVQEVVKKVSPAVVAITGSSQQGMMGSGSGVIISKDGLILTAGHVLAATGQELTITLPGGIEVKGKSLGRNMNRDAALAQITQPGEYPFVDMAPAESVEAGEWVLALGHPGGYDPLRGAPLRVGRLWEADTKSYFRSDCTVSGGDSGGPLFDLEGRVVGIHSSISQKLSENRHVPIGVFHNDLDRLQKGDVWGRLSNLMPGMPDDDDEDRPGPRGEEPRPRRQSREREAPPAEPKAAPTRARVFLGVQLESAADGSGVQVVEVADGSPAAKAGLQLEDLIVKINGDKVTKNSDVVSRVTDSKPGDQLKLTIRRGKEEKELDVTLAPAP